MSCFSEDEDLDKVWPRIIQQSNEKANWRLDQAGGNSVELVLAKIHPPKKEKSQSLEITKKVFEKSLVCVSRFGGIIAQSASVVFGPSQQCFNAVSFVIDAVQKYEEVFANVTILMERMSAFLERLRSYLDQKQAEEKLDRRLRITVYRVLEHFLTVLGIWHKLTTKKTAKFTLGLKVVFFGEDDGVKDAMAKLETLVLDVTRAEVTAIFQTVSAAARSLQVVEYKLDKIGQEQEKTTASIGRLESAEDEKKRLEEISRALSIDANKRPWVDIHNDLWRSHVPETGQWLLTYDKSPKSFVKWADSKAPHLNTLAIVGGEQYGKSYLCSAVIHHLLKRYGDDPRACVAYYYLQPASFSAATTEAGSTTPPPRGARQGLNVQRDTADKSYINAALRSILYQLASAPTSAGRDFARAIRKSCVDHKDEFGKSAELWNRLVTDAAKNISATFFIVIDGVDGTDPELEQPFAAVLKHIMSLNSASPLKIRLLFTGRQEDMEALGDLNPRIPQIDMVFNKDQPPLNQEDILLYAELRLSKMLIFRRKDEYVTQLKERAKVELANGVRGDYFALNAKLETLEQSRTPQDVDEVLSRAKETRAEEIARDISLLNETLREDEIRELNTLLSWDSVCFESLTLDQYKAVLDLSADNKALVPLEMQIKDRYFRLFALDEKDGEITPASTVTLKSTDIRKHLQSTNVLTRRDTRGHAHLHGPIQDGEAALLGRLIKKFLKRSFGGNEMYEKFGFDEFFAEKRGAEAVRVRLTSPADNHVQVARGCLVAICDHFEDEDFSQLREYAWQYFVDHLLAERSLDQENWIEDVPIDIKQEIGRKLVRLLRDGPLITANEQSWLEWSKIEHWILTADYSDVTFKWLRDPEVQKGLRDMPQDRQWVMEKCTDTAPSVGILHDVMETLAKRWYEGEVTDWILGPMLYNYIKRTIGEKPLSVPVDLSVDQISSVELWARKQLIDCKDETKWHECLAKTLRFNNHAAEAIIRYRAMIELGDRDWKTRLELARTLKESKNPSEGIEELQNVINENQSSLASDDENEFKMQYWQSILRDLGECYVEIDDFITAEKTYRKILDEALRRGLFADWAMSAVSAIALVLNKQAKHKDTVQLLEELAQRPNEEFGSWLDAMFHTFAAHSDFHTQVRSAACGAGQIDLFVERYQSLLNDAQAKPDDSSLGIALHLRYYFALLLRSHESQEKQDMALTLWEENVSFEIPETLRDGYEWYELRWRQDITARRLAGTLLDAAKAAGLSMPLNSAASSFADRLDALIRQKKSVVSSARQYLGRLRHLAGDAEQARDLTRELAQEAFDGLEKKSGFEENWQMYELAVLLQLLDQDADALAAWQACAPLLTRANSDESPRDSPARVTNGIETPSSPVLGAQQSTGDSRVDMDRTADIDGTADIDCTAEMVVNDEVPTENGPDITASERADGGCDVCSASWSAHSSVWACRECMNVHFCPGCYDKLQEGGLDLDVCHPSHPFLHVPFLTEQEWRRIPADNVLVAGSYVPKKQWLESVKSGWGIDEVSVNAAKKIQTAWKNSQNSNGVPTLSRRQTTTD